MTERNKIVYGQWTFTDEQIHEGNVYLAMSLLSDSLEANTFEATVECPDKSILDFERNTPLTYFNRGRQIGIFYVQSITRNGPTNYTISATSAIGMLIEGLHYGGIYNGQSVAQVLPSICGTVPYVVKSDLQSIALYGWLPIASPRDNLSQILFAIGATVKSDLDGVLHIENLWDGISGTLSKDRMYMGPSVDYTAKVTQVAVTEHQYSEGGESVSLFEGTAQTGDIITFDEPVYALQAQGFTILESGANYAKLSAGAGTLTGTKYLHRTRQITKSVSEANEPNVKTVTDATMISVLNSQAVAERLVAYYTCLETIHADSAYRGEVPGDILTTWHPYDLLSVSACLENADVSLSNTLKAQETLLVGYVPPREEQAVIYDQKEILTGSGNWTVPDGVDSVHVVLIGGGGPGANGRSGFSSTWSTGNDHDRYAMPWFENLNENINISASVSSPSSPAGEGGEGGAAGVPGYVFEADLEVTPGQAIGYACGSAGSAPSQTGGATSFGSLTSSDGGLLENGYTDITTGVAYAVPGTAGVPGGRGGSAGQRGTSVAGVEGGYGISGDSDSDSGRRTQNNDEWNITVNTSASWSYTPCGGGGAGGGTESNPGQPGSNAAKRSSGTLSVGNILSVQSFASDASPGSGGDGADGKDAQTYGSAGDGGSGGGGGGAAGSRSSQSSLTATVTKKSVGGAMRWEYFDAYAGVQSGGSSGGSGGAGGQGMPGCIILYYGVQTTIQTGAVKDSSGDVILDRYGRILVV